MLNNEIKSNNTHVPDKLYGYSIQIHQMLFELLNSESDSVVSVEKIDDVGVEKNDEKKAIQVKSALSSRNPVSDFSEDLWKTLFNWILCLKNEELSLNHSAFTLVINVDKSGKIVEWLKSAKDKSDSEKVYDNIKQYVYKNGVLKTKNKKIKNYIETFLDKNNKKYVLYVIEKFDFVIMSESHTQKIYEEFRTKTYLPVEYQEFAFNNILGWIDNEVSILVEKGKYMQISKARFNNQMVLLQRKINQKIMLINLAKEPSKNAVDKEMKEPRTYIKQLQIVDLEYEDQISAVTDYLMASYDRTMLASKGEINQEDMNKYFENLRNHWRTKRKIIELEKEDFEDKKKGRLLYYKCLDDDIKDSIFDTSRNFKNGCYHELADKKAIGWHPDYIEILKEEFCDD